MTQPRETGPTNGERHEAGEGVSDDEMRDTVAEQTDSASEHADIAGKDWDGEDPRGPQPI